MLGSIHQLQGQEAVTKYTKAIEYLLFLETLFNAGRIQITKDGFVQKPIVGSTFKSVSPAQALSILSSRAKEGIRRLDSAPALKTKLVERIGIEMRDNPFVQEFEELIGVYADELGETASLDNIIEHISERAKEQIHQDKIEGKVRKRKRLA